MNPRGQVRYDTHLRTRQGETAGSNTSPGSGRTGLDLDHRTWDLRSARRALLCMVILLLSPSTQIFSPNSVGQILDKLPSARLALHLIPQTQMHRTTPEEIRRCRHCSPDSVAAWSLLDWPPLSGEGVCVCCTNNGPRPAKRPRKTGGQPNVNCSSEQTAHITDSGEWLHVLSVTR